MHKVRWWLGTWTEAYGWLIRPHWFATGLAVLAIGSFLFHAVHWLALPVWTVPPSP
ncbi:MAG: hypothetical protein V2A79_11465 [Planctomycetota bacterium]